MESRDHARLGPSAAHRWMTCPASVRVAESLEIAGADTSSTYAAEGTAAHTIAELVASYRFGLITTAMLEAALAAWRGSNDGAEWLGDRTIEQAEAEMIEHGQGYADLIASIREPGDELHLELRVFPGVEGVWGTGDTVLIGPRKVTIIDYKYGEGVRVDAYANEQLMFYGSGAVEADLLGTATLVEMVVYQPRLDHVSRWEISIEQLLNWRDEVARPAAERALTDDAPFGPSEEACRFCPARGQCRAQMDWIANRDFGQDLDVMDGDDFAEALQILPAVRAWASAVEEKALERVYSNGGNIPGWKVVLSGKQRKIRDEAAAIDRLEQAGYKREDVTRPMVEQIQTLGVLDKVVKVGRTKVLAKVLGDLLGETDGRPSLVTEDDPRPVHVKEDQAAADFAEPLEED